MNTTDEFEKVDDRVFYGFGYISGYWIDKNFEDFIASETNEAIIALDIKDYDRTRRIMLMLHKAVAYGAYNEAKRAEREREAK